MKETSAPAAAITFTATPYQLKDWVILRLPEEASKQLPSRGQVAVEMRVQESAVTAVLEPDGDWGHWLRVTDKLQSLGVMLGEPATLTITVTKAWPEPSVPQDIALALDAAPQAVKDKWQDITPMARWEWVRWTNATASTETRAVRIEKTISKLAGTHRRPCCFNLAACTEPYVAKSGRLIQS